MCVNVCVCLHLCFLARVVVVVVVDACVYAKHQGQGPFHASEL